MKLYLSYLTLYLFKIVFNTDDNKYFHSLIVFL